MGFQKDLVNGEAFDKDGGYLCFQLMQFDIPEPIPVELQIALTDIRAAIKDLKAYSSDYINPTSGMAVLKNHVKLHRCKHRSRPPQPCKDEEDI